MPPAQQEGQPDDLAVLVGAAGRGDEAAWRGLIALFSRRVYALVRSRCGRDDLAEEVTQSVFVTVAEQLGSRGYTERGRFESWLFLVAMNRLRDELRRERRQASPTEPERIAEHVEHGQRRTAETESRLDDPERERLRSALERLGDADRTVIELRHHAGLSFKQMAETLREPVGTLLARHHRALAKLRAMLSADEVPPDTVLTDRRRSPQ